MVCQRSSGKRMAGQSVKSPAARQRMKGVVRDVELLTGFWCDEDAVGVVEIILILVVLISLVLIFKEQLTTIVQNIFKKISSQSNSV